MVKTPIPGTEWLRVITNEGNTFYTHTARKQSVWTVPDEIKDAVEQLEREEALKKAKEAEETARKAEEKKAAREAERILAEAQGIAVKRKAAEAVPMDEFVVSKKAKVAGEAEDEGMSDEEDDEDSDESEEEEWQKEAAAQLAKEAEEEKVRQEEERKREEEEARKLKEAEKQRGKAQLHMPERVDLSIEEAKALFKVGR